MLIVYLLYFKETIPAVPQPSGRQVHYVSEEASPYIDLDVVVIEEDYVSGDEDQRNVVYHEEHAPFEDKSPSMASHAPPRCKVLLGSPP